MGTAALHRRRCHGDGDAYLKMWLHGGIQKRRNHPLCSILGTVSMSLFRYNNSVSELSMLVTHGMSS